jgi:hypothetical protein
MVRRLTLASVTVVGAVAIGVAALGAGPAWGCGFLVAPNGAVDLERTTTLAAYHDGLEHYITSFSFSGTPAAFGSIVPLPGEPTKVERGGDWTLQRLEREVNPPLAFEAAAATTAAASAATVLLRTRIDSLDIAVLKGGGQSVFDWANTNGFDLPGDTVSILTYYSDQSPYFMVARFDTEAAQAAGLSGGDGIPIHITIPVEHPWVPLRILAAAKPADEIVAADVFLLTDTKPSISATFGPRLERSEPASGALLTDLRSDKGMSWVPDDMWLTYLAINSPAGQVTGDLSINEPGLQPFLVTHRTSNLATWAGWSLVAAATVAAALLVIPTRRRRPPAAA